MKIAIRHHLLLGITLHPLGRQSAAHNRGDNFRGGNLVRINVEDILRKNDQVGKLANLERTFRFSRRPANAAPSV